MSSSTAVPASEGQRRRRATGRYSAGRAGPTLVVLGGIHGNEPAGVAAQERVLRRLQQEALPVRGTVAAFAGNLPALATGQRFIRRDLNRQWLGHQLADLRRRDPVYDDEEDREQRELVAEFDRCVEAAEGPVVFLDLHTSSAAGPPFCCMGDTMANRRIAFSLPVPVILGLEEAIDGAVLEYFNERGCAGIAIEGGQHGLPATVDALEAAIWLVMVAIGALPASALPDLSRFRQVLAAAAEGTPAVVEIRGHHRITAADGFVMRPGYRSFQPVGRGEVLADDRRGPVRATESGRVLLPLYQGLGEDGFFLCRDVAPFWLHVARWLRAAQTDRLVALLPGVRRHPTRADALLVDPRVARWLVREVFHLLGYRRCRPEADRLVFSRRRVSAATAALPWRE